MECPEPGTGCTFVSGGVGCGRVGPRQAGDPCATAGQCGPGLGCVGPQGDATCRIICGSDRDCPEGATCSISVHDQDGNELGMVCADPVQACTLLAQDCPEGEGCYPMDSSLLAFGCRRAGEAGLGEPCSGYAGCEAGMLCMRMNGAQAGECVAVCALEGQEGPGCPEGLDCQDLLPDWHVGGLCVPSQDQ